MSDLGEIDEAGGRESANPGIAPRTPADRMVSFQRFARIVQTITGVVLVALPLLIAVYAFGFSAELARHPAVAELRAVAAPLGPLWSTVAFLVLIGASVPMLYALAAARRLFGGYAEGRVFTTAAADDLRRIAVGLLLAAVIGPVAGVALSLVLSAAGNAHGITLSIGSDQIFFALFGLIVLGIARVMRDAAAMADDYAAIV